MVECKECVHYLVCKQYKNKPYFCNQYMDYKNTVEVVRCKDCKHSKLPAVLTQKYGEPGTLTCHNWHSPCNKRNVKTEDFCSHGERKDND